MPAKIAFILLFNLYGYFSYAFEVTGKTYTSEDGMPDNSVTCFFKGPNAFIWFGTYNGLSRFDGYEFLNFGSDEDNTLSDQSIINLTGDASKLYIGTYNGISILSFADGTIKSFKNADEQIFKIKGEAGGIALGAGELYVGIEDTLYIVDKRKLQILHKVKIPGQQISVVKKSNEQILIGTNTGLYAYALSGRTIKNILNEELHVSDILPDKGSLFVNTFNGFRVVDKTGSIEKYGEKQKGRKQSILMKGIIADGKGNYFTPSDGVGIFQYNAKEKRFMNHTKGEVNGLLGNIICFFNNDNGTIWCGSYMYGLQLISFEKKPVTAIKYNPYSDAPVPNATISSINFFNDYMWIGSDGGGLMIKALGADSAIEHSLVATDGKVISMSQNKEGLIVLGTYGNGLIFCDDKGKAVNLYDDVSKQLSNHINQVFFDSRGRLWVTSFFDGVYLVDLATGSVNNFTTVNGINLMEARAIMELPDGDILFGSMLPGLILYKDNNFSIYDKHEALSVQLKVADFDATERYLVVGTGNEGLLIYDQSMHKVNRIVVEDDISKNSIQSVLIYRNHIWLTTNNSIQKRNFKGELIKKYQPSMGYPSIYFFHNCKALDDKHRLYFGGVGGVMQVDESINNKSEVQHDPLLSWFKSGSMETKKVFVDQQQYVFPYDEKKFVFSLGTLNYGKEHIMKYSVKLDGFEDNFHALETRNIIHYTNLSSGEYNLFIKTWDGVHWSEPNLLFSFVVETNFWDSLLFYTLQALFFIALLIIALVLRKRGKFKFISMVLMLMVLIIVFEIFELTIDAFFIEEHTTLPIVKLGLNVLLALLILPLEKLLLRKV